MLLAQNLILMGIFFTIPLFLQVVQGLDALDTGVRMLPASVGLFVSALAGSALAKRFPARTLVRAGLCIVFVSTLLLLDTIDTTLDSGSFLVAMGVLGVGMGLVVSQLGNVVQSAVGEADRSEAGGLQNTAAQLGSSLGTALLGAVVITGLIATFSNSVAANPTIAAEAKQEVEVEALVRRVLRRLRPGAVGSRGRRLRRGQRRRPGRGLRGLADRRAQDRVPVRRPDRARVLVRDPATCRPSASRSSRRRARRRLRPPMPEAVVFDLDGVLLDSEQRWNEAKEEVTREAGGRWRAEAARGDDGDELAGVVGLHARRARGAARAPSGSTTRSSSGWRPATRASCRCCRARSRRSRRLGGALAARARLLFQPRDHRRRSSTSPGSATAFAVTPLLRGGGPRQAGARRLPRGGGAARRRRRRAASPSRTPATGSAPRPPRAWS